jgi:hypothetical protein
VIRIVQNNSGGGKKPDQLSSTKIQYIYKKNDPKRWLNLIA